MAKTLCPACGHSPIPPGAEECPVCGEPFAFLQAHKRAKNVFLDKREGEENESTVFGGNLTGEVAAHPWQPALVLFAGAAIWFIRAAGLLGDFGDPRWVYAVVLADLLAGLLLVVNAGPAKLLAQVVLFSQMGIALFLGRAHLADLVQVLYAVHAAIGLFLVVGEPSVVRRYLGLVAGLLIAGGAVAVQVVKPLPPKEPRKELYNPKAGYGILLPLSYDPAKPAELTRHLKAPPLGLTASSIGFASAQERTVGLLIVDRNEEVQVIGGCQALHLDLGGTNVPRPLPGKAPSGLGEQAVVYELRTFSGATGRLGCGRLSDGRFAALAVLSVNPNPEAGAEAFEVVGEGVSIK